MSNEPHENAPTRMPIAILVGIFAVIIIGVGAFYVLRRGHHTSDANKNPQGEVNEAFKKSEYKLALTPVADR